MTRGVIVPMMRQKSRCNSPNSDSGVSSNGDSEISPNSVSEISPNIDYGTSPNSISTISPNNGLVGDPVEATIEVSNINAKDLSINSINDAQQTVAEATTNQDLREDGATVLGDQREVDIENGLYHVGELRPRTVIRVEPVEGDSSLFCVRLLTGHYAFSLKNSCTLRRIKEFYQIEAALKWRHPYVVVPSMPLRPILWMSGQQSKLSSLATFLSLVLTQRQLLSNRGLHLFLQTQLSMDVILQNLNGERDDQVVEKEICRSGEGFRELFGKAFREGNNRSFEYCCQ